MTTNKPWESAPAEHQDGPKPWESAPAAHQEEATTPSDLPDGMQPFKLPNGNVTLQRQDGAVYIKEANDPRFKGQEGWKYQDPKTGIFVPAPDTDATHMSWLEKHLGADAWKGMGRNLKAAITSPADAIASLVHAPGQEGRDQAESYRQALQNTGGLAAKATQLAGEAVPMAAAMALVPEAEAATLISRLAQTGLKAAPYAYLTTHGDQATRLKAGAVAGMMAPAAQLGLEKVAVPGANLASQGIKALLGKSTAISPEAAELAAQAAEHGIPLSTGESLPNVSRVGRLARGLEDSGEPTARWFTNTNKAQDKAGEAAKGLLKQVQEKGQSMGFESEAALQQALKQQPQNSQLQALDRLVQQAKSGNTGDVAEASSNLKNWSTRQEIGEIFDQARAAADTMKKKFSSLTGTTKAFSQIMDEINQLPPSTRSKFSDLQNLQQDFETSLEKDGDKGVRTYNSLDATRKWLGDQARDTADSTTARYYRILKQGIQEDQQRLATANPGTKFQQLFDNAKSRWASEVTPFEDNAVAKAMKSSTPDEVQAQFLKRGDYEDRGLKFFQALDPKGQQAVKEKFLQDAIDAATDRTQPGQPFDPHKFVGYLDQFRGARKVIMQGADSDALNGLENIMQHIKARPNSSVKPTFFSSLSAGGAAVLNTGPVRKLLLAADTLRPGSSALDKLLAQSTAVQIGKSTADAQEKK